ncbi:hypothetical protein WSS_A16311 [Rhodococcus opacus M213]|uniref:Uncharacterized protein n=1 Tax=Rhodococcus opacus M213 TaxID=1129896 RepID=K8XWU5_RHOOP|nr:hypothetical protein [Rhodococcus opacus]EKT81625.1 hypothetical protein WSS_A16311 [Rhodococcus opacus M213]
MTGWLVGLAIIGFVFFIWLWGRHTLVVAALYLLAWLGVTIYFVVDTVLYNSDDSWFERAGYGFMTLVICAVLGFVGLMFVIIPETVRKPRKRTGAWR